MVFSFCEYCTFKKNIKKQLEWYRRKRRISKQKETKLYSKNDLQQHYPMLLLIPHAVFAFFHFQFHKSQVFTKT